MNKILTVVIPTYNMEEYLDKCLTSLIVSDTSIMRQLEVLVVIDGAKDRSSEIAHGYQDRYPDTFKVIDKENGNYGSCINRGLKEAQGKYIKILDADDCFDNRYFADYLLFLLRCDVDLVINDLIRVNTKGKESQRSVFHLPKEISFGMGLLSKEMRELFAMHRVTYKTNNLRKIHYEQTEGVSYTDQEWIFLPMTTVKTIAYFDKCLYRYLVGREGQTMDPKVAIRSANHHIVGAKKMINEYESLCYTDDKIQRYLDERLVLRCSKIYYDYLSNKVLPLNDIIEFDNYVKKNSINIYRILEKSNIAFLVPYNYIHVWHKKNRCKRLNMFFKYLAFFSNKCRSVRWRLIHTIY